MKSWLCASAIKESFKSKYPHWNHAALISNGPTILAKGVNVKKPFTPQPEKYSIHAEISVINKLDIDQLVGASIYCAMTKRGIVSNSKPCEACEKRIRAVGIRKIYYTIAPQEWGMLRLY